MDLVGSGVKAELLCSNTTYASQYIIVQRVIHNRWAEQEIAIDIERSSCGQQCFLRVEIDPEHHKHDNNRINNRARSREFDGYGPLH